MSYDPFSSWRVKGEGSCPCGYWGPGEDPCPGPDGRPLCAPKLETPESVNGLHFVGWPDPITGAPR